KLFSISNEAEFNEAALDIFRLQAEKCAVYKEYINILNINAYEVKDVYNIPFLPIEFFKSHDVILEGQIAQQTFTSSGTTGIQTSKHLVSDLSIYEESFRNCFEIFYGDIKDVAILALLPSYLERTGSSLIYMIDD